MIHHVARHLLLAVPWLVLILMVPVFAQTTSPTQQPPPTLDSIRQEMAVPSDDGIRGRIDSMGYALRPEQMAKIWELSASPPEPEILSPMPDPGVAALISPHDDFAFAGRIYRRVLPLVTAKTVVVIGVFHRYWKFNEHDHIVFDSYNSWTAPDGLVPVSPLRDALLARLPKEDWEQSTVGHDSEHSLEPIVVWLRHMNPDLEIVPIICPAAHFERFEEIADHLGSALSAEMTARGWELGRDLAIVISTDGIHYGPDFEQTRFGEGGIDAYEKATALDKELMSGPLSGELTVPKIQTLYSTFVDPEHPDTYRWTWCGRFSVPFGLLTLERLTRDNGGVIGHPLAYGTSISAPLLPLSDLGMGVTAPSNLYHFVGYPTAAFTVKGSGQ